MSDHDASNQPRPLKRKTVELTFEKVTIADPAVDILQMFKLNSNAHFDISNVWTIDVFPTMIPIIMYIILSAIRQYGNIANRDFSKITPSTLCIYYMCIVYGFFLINDLEVRPQPSAHARSWKDNSWKRSFVNLLKSLPVPEFLTTILSQFHPMTTDRTKNVFFIPSAAGYDHDQFFGRVFPVNFFAEIHDCIANLSSSSSLYQILQHLFSKSLYTIGNNFTCLIPDLIGISVHRTTANHINYMNSKLYQVMNCLFNPVLFRDIQRRPTLAALSLEAPAYADAHVNAYDMMFSATSNNLRELQIVLNAVAAVIKSTIPIKGRLDTFISEASGDSILMHGYSSFALPTWSHGEEATKADTFRGFTSLNRVTPTARATDFSFLQRPTVAIPATQEVVDVTYVATDAPTAPLDLPAGHSLVRHFPGSLRANADAERVFPRHDSCALVTFVDSVNATPKVLVLDTEGNQGLNAYLATLTGKVIESFELDGTIIEVPNTDKSIGPQNCLFAESAIPYKYVRPGSDYHPRAPGEILPPLDRLVLTPTSRLTASTILHCNSRIMLPHFQRMINEPLNNTLPGMTPVIGAISTRYCQSMIGFQCCDGSSNYEGNDAVPAMQTGNLLVWSPYTYTPYESNDWPVTDLSQSRHYYLTNLRTIFGTDFNLVQVEHAYDAFPVV
jgi:hypothetical protein